MEEMPARFINPALEQLKDLAEEKFKVHRLPFLSVRTYSTPRRLLLHVIGLEPVQEPLVQEIKGPAAKVAFDENRKYTRAAQGFAKSQRVDLQDLIIKPVGTVDYVFAVNKQAGRPAAEVLLEICPDVISSLHFPKSMRWGKGEMRFIRPIRWLLALYGEQVIPFVTAELIAGNITYGHRFYSNYPIMVQHPDDYFEKIDQAKIMIDQSQRQSIIWEKITELAAQEGGEAKPDPELLEQVANLVEYPTVIVGSFNNEYLQIPQEVLITSMRDHLRCFPVFGPDSSLLARFIAVSNNGGNDLIRSGFERVLRARLADAAFFWNEDLKTPLVERADSLKRIVWQENLGTLYEKMERVTSICFFLCMSLGVEQEIAADTLRASRLAKADLSSNVVYEFPELQGIMGCEYAKRQGEKETVSLAIADHYLPRFSGDKLPSETTGIILAVADKLDTLVGCFAAGIQPTGSQDPYGLRRQALGVCHIVLENALVFCLHDILAAAYQSYLLSSKLELAQDEVLKELEVFFTQRLRNIFSDRGISYDICEAVLSVGVDDLYGSWQKASALKDLSAETDFQDLLVAFHRAYNISRKHNLTEVDETLFQHPVETDLNNAFINTREKVEQSVKERDFRSAVMTMTQLRKPVDSFFEGVMVMAEDEKIRNNRLSLLKNIVNLVFLVADLSKLG
ncbi:MAG: Glycine--tRNA ligase beta subunit [Desulfofundulus kuznetsovii]|nr:MAG: Glycine--tRNA ligase beta subunit [Desulfotomaculum sp. 46_80]KUK84997.1 MAG: Glycine--tRNA ligase beta subunit [Desulfofundulus kuznetsovii]